MKKTYFITGGTGSFAKRFVQYLLEKKMAKKIIIFSRDEYKQFIMKEDDLIKKNISMLRFLIGDIRDKDRLDFAVQDNIDV